MQTETKYFCKKCGKELSVNERPCSNCGSNARHIELNINDYFPAGSTELNSVKHRIESLKQNDNYTDDSLIITRKEFYSAMAKSDKKAKLYFVYGLSIGIIGIIVTVITSYFW